MSPTPVPPRYELRERPATANIPAAWLVFDTFQQEPVCGEEHPIKSRAVSAVAARNRCYIAATAVPAMVTGDKP